MDEPGSPYDRLVVDITGLDDLAQQLQGRVDKDLKPQITPMLKTFETDSFGVYSASQEVYAARVAYHDCMTASSAYLDSCIISAQAMIDAARDIAAAYRGTDAMAHARMDDVNAALSNGLVKAQDALGKAQAAQAQAEAAAAAAAHQAAMNHHDRSFE